MNPISAPVSPTVAHTNPWGTPVSAADYDALQARRTACAAFNDTVFKLEAAKKALAAARTAHRAARRTYERADARWLATPSGHLETAAREKFRAEFDARRAQQTAA